LTAHKLTVITGPLVVWEWN